MNDLRHFVRALAAITAVGLAVWPGVGLFQAALTGILIAAIARLWRMSGAHVAEARAVRSGFARSVGALAWLALTALPAAYPALLLQVYDEIVARGPELLWLFAGIPAALGVAALIALGRATVGPIAQGLVLGLVSTAIWVPLGRMAGLDGALRFHPVATIALAGATLALTGAFGYVQRRRGDAARWASILFAQSLGIGAYWLVGSADSFGKLGYIANESAAVSADGRLVVEVTERDSAAMVFIADPTLDERRYVTTIYGPHAGRRFVWSHDKLEVRWFAPRDTYDADCTAQYLYSDFWHSQARQHTFAICEHSESPLGCHGRQLSRGAACERDRDCATEQCMSGVCVGSALGARCVTDQSCDEGTCVGRVCRVKTGVCDSNADCGRYCYRDPGEMFGQCYGGDPPDPCTGAWGECLNSKCIAGTCTRQ